jgi:hypothetical protein
LPISNILDYYNGVNTKTLEAVLEDLKSIQIKGMFCNGSGEDPNAAHVGRQTVGNDLYLTRSLWTV